MFRLLINRAIQLDVELKPNPIDFKYAVICAIKEIFPASTIKGCVLHFTRLIFRKEKQVGLQAQRHTEYVRNIYKSLSALALVLIDQIYDEYNMIYYDMVPEKTNPHYDKLHSILSYFVHNWFRG